MTKNNKQKMKQILAHTESKTLAKLFPHLNDGEIIQIDSLVHYYQNTNSAIKEKQNLSRKLSGQIGDAKKKGHGIEELLSEMHANSLDLKHLENERQKLQENIFSFLPQQIERPEHTSNPLAEKKLRAYPDITISQDIKISPLENEHRLWDAYVDMHPAASVYHLAGWRDLIAKTFGHKSYYYYAHDTDSNIRGVLPLIRLNSLMFGDFLVSMPYFNYGGAVGDHPQVENMLIEHANSLAAKLKIEYIEYRDDIPKVDMPERTEKVNMILALPSDMDDLWQSFTPKLRSQIKRPQREDTNVKLGNQDLLDDFYRVFARNMRDLGTPVYDKAFFRNILESFPDRTHILTVYLQGKPVGGSFLIGYKDTLEIPWASTIRSANQISVNMLMYWEVLKFAIREQYAYFDFGRSSIDSGTYRFKEQWGATPKQLYWHYWPTNRKIPSLNPSNPKYKLMIKTWKLMPIWMTKLIGPRIVKNLP